MNSLLSVYDILLPPLYLIIALGYGYVVTKRNIRERPEYEYFFKGLLVRIIGSISLGLVYFFYYSGGDTTNYFQTASAYASLFSENETDFWIGWLGDAKKHYFNFTVDTGYPVYAARDNHSFFVVRLLIPVVTLGLHSYFASAILIATFTYGGLWKLYQTFLLEFPALKKELAIACLFVPSCVFWGSGLMKDSITLSAVGWFTYSFYHFFILKKWKISYALQFVIASIIILAIKPYIFFALFPGAILWLSNQQIRKINNQFIRIIAAPVLLLIGGSATFFALQQMGDNLGQYKVDTIIDKAITTQQDMKADHYGGKAYDIGNFDGSFIGIISKAPIAIFSGIFRPGIWDVKNIVMLISSLENTYLLFLSLLLLFKLKFFGFFSLIGKNPLLLFTMLFSMFFAFSVGLTVANFGSLVRLRIPELPFFVAGIFIIKHLYEQQSRTKLKI